MQRGMRREGRGLPAPREGARRFFYLFWNHAWKLIRLNLLFLACCIPVVTMPAALCAMDRALIVLVREGNVLLWEEFRDEFKKDFWRSLPLGLLFGGLLFLGYFIGVALGLVTGITCGYSARIRYWVDPIIKFLGPIPTSTWIPIIMVVTANLFGGSIFIIALGSWFAVTVASMTGISNVDRDYFEAARTLGASERQLVFRVAIPHAMPSILQGMTQAMSTACTAIMIAEMMGVKAGLGWYMTWAKSWAAFDKMFAALFVICLVFTAVTKALAMIKKHVLRWQIGVVK